MPEQNPLDFQGAGQAPLSTAPPTPAPTAPLASAPVPSSPAQAPIDPDVQSFTKAIAMQEGGGSFLPYDAKGKSGETGRYQFMPDTWSNYAQQVLGNANAPMTSANQNQVAYSTFKKWKDAGYSYAEMASMWNAGEGHPDAYKTGNVGINGEGVGYDTPTYVKNVQKYAQQLDKQQAPGYVQPPDDSGSSLSDTPATGDSAPEGLLQKAGDVAKGVGNFLFPIAGDVYNDVTGNNKKTALQQVGDAGLSALPFIPGLGEAGEAARGGEAAVEGAGAVAKSGILPKILGSTTAKGAATGYGAGVLNNLSQGQSIGQSITPGFSTIGGAVTGGVLGAVAPRLASFLKGSFTQPGAMDAATKGITEELSRVSPGRQLLSNLPENGQRAAKLLTASGALPSVEGTHFNVDDAIDNMEGRLASLGQTRAAAIQKLSPDISLTELGNTAKSSIASAPEGSTDAAAHVALQRTMSGESQAMSDKIDTIVKNIQAQTGRDSITAPELQALKEVQTANSGVYRRTGAIGDQNAASLLGEAAKTKMENIAKEAGFPGLKEYNQHMSDHYDAIKLLQQLRRQSVKGGRLGNMLTGHVVGAVAAGAANAAGGGFLGSMASLLAGESSGNFISKLMNSGENPFRASVLDKIEMEDPQIVQELKNFAGTEENVAPIKRAKGTFKSGILPGLLIKGGARAGAAVGGLAS